MFAAAALEEEGAMGGKDCSSVMGSKEFSSSPTCETMQYEPSIYHSSTRK